MCVSACNVRPLEPVRVVPNPLHHLLKVHDHKHTGEIRGRTHAEALTCHLVVQLTDDFQSKRHFSLCYTFHDHKT